MEEHSSLFVGLSVRKIFLTELTPGRVGVASSCIRVPPNLYRSVECFIYLCIFIAPLISPREILLKGRLSTVDLIVVTSLDQPIFIL